MRHNKKIPITYVLTTGSWKDIRGECEETGGWKRPLKQQRCGENGSRNINWVKWVRNIGWGEMERVFERKHEDEVDTEGDRIWEVYKYG